MSEEQADFDRELAIRAHERAREFLTITNGATMDAGVAVVRTLVLVNGGAVVAVLAFLANVIDSSNGARFEPVFDALSLFGFGVLCAVVTAGGTYLTNYCHAAVLATQVHIWTHPYIKETGGSRNWSRIGNVLHVITVLFGVASIVFLLCGIMSLKASVVSLF